MDFKTLTAVSLPEPFTKDQTMPIMSIAMHMYPFVSSGLFGRNEAVISRAIMPSRRKCRYVAHRFGGYLSRDRLLVFSENQVTAPATVAIAPSSTAQKIPGEPFIQKKSKKSRPPVTAQKDRRCVADKGGSALEV